MRIVAIVARFILGLLFTVFGLNGLFHFMPNPPATPGAAAFFGALAATHYMFALIFVSQVIGGVLLLIGIWIPFAVVLLAPIVVNIVAFHIFLAPAVLPLAIVVLLCWLILVWQNREAYAPLFR